MTNAPDPITDLDLLEDEDLEAGETEDSTYGLGIPATEDIVPAMIAQRDELAARITSQAGRWQPQVTQVAPSWATVDEGGAS